MHARFLAEWLRRYQQQLGGVGVSQPNQASAVFGGGGGSFNAVTIVFRPLATESWVFGCGLALVGAVLWKFKHMRGLGDGVLATAVFVLLAVGLKRLQILMQGSSYSICHRILRRLHLEIS
jgi:hypothetical protein